MKTFGDWLVCHHPRDQVRLRLFCFPHAGVGASVYRRWSRGLPDDVEVWALMAPGRETRIREAAPASIRSVAEAFVEQHASFTDAHDARPYALFGHSMGAVIALAAAKLLHDADRPAPVHLVVSGRRPPRIAFDEPVLHTLSDADFVAALGQRYGGIPAAVQRDAALMALLLPCLRADIAALETHHPTLGTPLGCPITVFGGDADALAPPDMLEAWRAETTGPFRARVFEGGHFYLEPRRDEVLAEMTSILR